MLICCVTSSVEMMKTWMISAIVKDEVARANSQIFTDWNYRRSRHISENALFRAFEVTYYRDSTLSRFKTIVD